MSHKDEINTLINWLLDQGFAVCQTRKGHWRVDILDQGPVFLPSTPSDHRAVKNARAMIRRKLAGGGWKGPRP